MRPRDAETREALRSALGALYDRGVDEWRPNGIRYANRDAAISEALIAVRAALASPGEPDA